jgi:hypothetical protein
MFVGRGMKMTCMAERRGTCSVLVGTPEGRRPLGRPGVRLRIILKWKTIAVSARSKA